MKVEQDFTPAPASEPQGIVGALAAALAQRKTVMQDSGGYFMLSIVILSSYMALCN